MRAEYQNMGPLLAARQDSTEALSIDQRRHGDVRICSVNDSVKFVKQANQAPIDRIVLQLSSRTRRRDRDDVLPAGQSRFERKFKRESGALRLNRFFDRLSSQKIFLFQPRGESGKVVCGELKLLLHRRMPGSTRAAISIFVNQRGSGDFQTRRCPMRVFAVLAVDDRNGEREVMLLSRSHRNDHYQKAGKQRQLEKAYPHRPNVITQCSYESVA
jgi:hypothetical protein